MSEQKVEHKFYDHGWNAYIDGVPYDPFATQDWKNGWVDCRDAKPEQRIRCT